MMTKAQGGKVPRCHSQNQTQSSALSWADELDVCLMNEQCVYKSVHSVLEGFSGGSVLNNLPTNARRHRFDPWVGKIRWRRKW